MTTKLLDLFNTEIETGNYKGKLIGDLSRKKLREHVRNSDSYSSVFAAESVLSKIIGKSDTIPNIIKHLKPPSVNAGFVKFLKELDKKVVWGSDELIRLLRFHNDMGPKHPILLKSVEMLKKRKSWSYLKFRFRFLKIWNDYKDIPYTDYSPELKAELERITVLAHEIDEDPRYI